MDLLGYKWTKGQSDIEIIMVEKINDLEHYELMYKDAFNVTCAKMEFKEEFFDVCQHKTDECKDVYFCIVEETKKDVVLEKPVITDGMSDFEKQMILELPEVCYGKNIIHMLINKTGCFRFTADNQTYMNTEVLKTEAEAEYVKMLTAFASLIGDGTQGENRVVQKNGALTITHLSPQDLAIEKIAELRQQLEVVRGMVIDNQECMHCGEDCIHEPKKLHAEGKAIRDKINKLEQSLKTR